MSMKLTFSFCKLFPLLLLCRDSIIMMVFLFDLQSQPTNINPMTAGCHGVVEYLRELLVSYFHRDAGGLIGCWENTA